MNRAMVMKRKRRRHFTIKCIKITIFTTAAIAAYYLLWIPYSSSIFDPSVPNNTDGSSYVYSKDEPVKKQTDKAATKKPSVDSRYLMLVNKNHLLPADYEVNQVLLSDGSKYVSDIIREPLEQMLADGGSQGLRFAVVSGYRTISYQDHLIQKKMRSLMNEQGMGEEEAYKEATRSIMPPRSSEHCSGLSVDITSASYTGLDERQETTAEYKWLVKNCWKYGFIVRYPKGKEDITGIIYEPWHFRYVGSQEVAKYIMDNGLTLEEYLDK